MDTDKKTVQIHFLTSEKEAALIRARMNESGVRNMAAYLRKMAICGYIVRLDLDDVREMVSLLRRCSNNLNQYAKRANETGSAYAADIEDVRKRFDRIWESAEKILSGLSKIP